VPFGILIVTVVSVGLAQCFDPRRRRDTLRDAVFCVENAFGTPRIKPRLEQRAGRAGADSCTGFNGLLSTLAEKYGCANDVLCLI